MAFSDYHACDLCGECKTFYDADMDYADDGKGGYTYSGHRVVSICHKCAETHEIVIRPIEAKESTHE